MISNKNQLLQLIDDKLQELILSPDDTLNFLHFAAKHYKQEYNNILLAYIQMPNATAIANFDFWTSKLHKHINLGETGIRMLSDSTSSGVCAKMFDVSQTHGGADISKLMWKYSAEHHAYALQAAFAAEDIIPTTISLIGAYIGNLQGDDDVVYLEKTGSMLTAYSAAIITAARLDLYVDTDIIQKFKVIMRGLNTGDAQASLQHGVARAGVALRQIERSVRNEYRNSNTERQAVRGEQQHNNNTAGAKLPVQENAERASVHTDDASRWNAGLRHRGHGGGGHRETEAVRGDTGAVLQPDILPVSSRAQATGALRIDKGGQITLDEISNRQGLFGKIFQSYGSAQGRAPQNTSADNKLVRGELERNIAVPPNSRGTHDAVYVGDIRPGNTAEINQNEPSDDGSFFVGDEIDLEGRRYKIESINREYDKVSLLDLTFARVKGFPIFSAQVLSRVEQVIGSTISERMEVPALLPPALAEPQQTLADILVEKEHDKEQSPTLAQLLTAVPVNSSSPEGMTQAASKQSATDYRIERSFNQTGGPKTRCAGNIAAIMLLNKLSAEDRQADSDEQHVLSQYVGWGGIAAAFDPDNAAWANEYAMLKNTLSEDEYNRAKASTLTSFYTGSAVIGGIYSALKGFGFTGGNILEPSMGIGNFFGYMPEELRKSSNLYGVEIDPVSAQIAKLLYPSASVTQSGFEDATFSNNFFDAAVSNIPFGDFKVFDQEYNKLNFNIHDYFFAKTIDKVRPGGVIAFVTSKGTMDKQDSRARRHIFERCDLIGAIRLPNNAFADAGTEVTSDVVFLQKRETIRLDEVPYLSLSALPGSIAVNEYFVQNPDMMLGVMSTDSSMYGSDTITTLSPFSSGEPLDRLLSGAVKKLNATYCSARVDITADAPDDGAVIFADGTTRNFTYTVISGDVYYRTNSVMTRQALPKIQISKISDYCALRDAQRALLNAQTQHSVTDAELIPLRGELGCAYDNFTAKHGYLYKGENNRLFKNDSDCNLVMALEHVQDSEITKADIFTRRTVQPVRTPTEAANAHDALAMSLNHRGYVDLDFISAVYGADKAQIVSELQGKIYRNPQKALPSDEHSGYESADEYLCGDIREKLSIARVYAESSPQYNANIEALTAALPAPISAGEIEARIGATWIDTDYYNQFMYSILNTSLWKRISQDGYSNARAIGVNYDKFSSTYKLSNTQIDNSANATSVYGTKRMNAYEIISESLNLRDVIIKDAVPYITQAGNDSVKYVVNSKETAIARQKQELIRSKFREWIFSDLERRNKLTETYNRLFNSIRHRTYNGAGLELPGINESIKLRPHQLDAIARLRSGSNTLLAHVVGAGKTYTMVAGAQEQLRIGLANKALFVVPNHLVPQFADDIMLLYPSARLLAAAKADFEKKNRQQFLSQIAMSDANMIVIGHSQFEKIMMSPEYQEKQLEEDISEITLAISDASKESGSRMTVKQLEKTKATIEVQLKKLTEVSRKDKMLTFEQLGVNSLFVDEAHYFKNCAIFSKLRNVAGINNSRAKKASDMLMKTKFVNEIGGTVTFATGTPISNSISETYVMQRYLQNDLLKRRGIRHFDEWASTFGETKTSLELAPEGGGYRLRTRFARFYNLPELMQLFCETADIQTADMLNLPVPILYGGKAQVISCLPSPELEEFMMSSVDRVAAIRDGSVDPRVDNMLKFISDFRKAGLDMRLIDSSYDLDPQGKLASCAMHIHRHYVQSSDTLGAQLVFCDGGTYNPAKTFDVYREIKKLLTQSGIPAEEIAFIHEAKNEQQKEDIFEKVRSGKIRVLLGSTQKCGAGTNVQDRLVALHHLDCPYRPSDIEQREGRILRQGNKNAEVSIYRYVTKRSFDAYLWNIVETKQKFISQLMRGTAVTRVCEDLDEVSIGFAEAQAIASGDPRIKEKIELDTEINRLIILRTQHLNEQYQMQDSIMVRLPKQIEHLTSKLSDIDADIAQRSAYLSITPDFTITLGKKVFSKREDAGAYLSDLIAAAPIGERTHIGSFYSLPVYVDMSKMTDYTHLVLCGKVEHSTECGESGSGNITRLENCIKSLDAFKVKALRELSETRSSLSDLQAQLGKPFELDDELQAKLMRQAELNELLDVGGRSDIIIADDEDLKSDETADIAEEYEDEEEDGFELD